MAFFGAFCCADAAAETSAAASTKNASARHRLHRGPRMAPDTPRRSEAPRRSRGAPRFCDTAIRSGADDMVRLGPEDHPSLNRLNDQVKPDPERGQQEQHREHAADAEQGVELEVQLANPALDA